MEHNINLFAYAPCNINRQRLDQIARDCFPEYSRSLLQQWIVAGNLVVDGKIRKPKDILIGGEKLSITAMLTDTTVAVAEDISLAIVYEDEHLLVINKPAGLVVHPGSGNHSGTLMNAILHHCPDSIKIPRAGIVHRLDKDTTGLLVVAKTLKAHYYLVESIKNRQVCREYEAITYGNIASSGDIQQPIGRHPKNRTKMAVIESGKPATTHYKVIKYYNNYSYIGLKLDSGRTHQIRVHLEYKGHPIVGDPTYNRKKFTNNSPAITDFLSNFNRQALHAKNLAFKHPVSDQPLQFYAELPVDFKRLLAILEAEKLTS
jgi:23S rRNA pseudouridine1911/1915/1917 synthase